MNIEIKTEQPLRFPELAKGDLFYRADTGPNTVWLKLSDGKTGAILWEKTLTETDWADVGHMMIFEESARVVRLKQVGNLFVEVSPDQRPLCRNKR